ncbi:MAG: LysE family translocator [Methanoregulaceae archaeon]
MAFGYGETLILGFLVGLTGALAPGPTLVATINSSLKEGWSAGPKVVAGHFLIEVLVVLLIVIGVSSMAIRLSTPIAVLGGVALIIFGILTIIESRNACITTTSSGACGGSYFSGVVTSATNPYFWIWWLTIGSVLLMTALSGGILLAFLFMIGHWAADLGWYTLVASVIHRSRMVLPIRAYRIVLFLCGGFLAGFGGYYLCIAVDLGRFSP